MKGYLDNGEQFWSALVEQRLRESLKSLYNENIIKTLKY